MERTCMIGAHHEPPDEPDEPDHTRTSTAELSLANLANQRTKSQEETEEAREECRCRVQESKDPRMSNNTTLLPSIHLLLLTLSRMPSGGEQRAANFDRVSLDNKDCKGFGKNEGSRFLELKSNVVIGLKTAHLLLEEHFKTDSLTRKDAIAAETKIREQTVVVQLKQELNKIKDVHQVGSPQYMHLSIGTRAALDVGASDLSRIGPSHKPVAGNA
ncbi:hypothetical protein THAOC_13433 [Thalassiosira oceanica]|uniref:Uncharacterized protein n=1 Tax=Thalassiosira oceanica TaxID=159749 RepID=K0SHU2_THAOC|nr:hypothetical protein THAOC_13433 [Thalassiosira oceanica]|eukprot:EJK65683.1 hypothetical protein THAOC_13433 [Thalassiosira oceanica]